nr:uncharacterized protein LOC109998143 [Labrus bergylta]
MNTFFISQLLLTTLLLRTTAEDAELTSPTARDPDGSVHYDEFCLRISDNSHWTSSRPVIQRSSESASQEPKPSKEPNGESTQLPNQPSTDSTTPYSQSPQPSTQPTPAYLESTTQPEQTTQKLQRPVLPRGQQGPEFAIGYRTVTGGGGCLCGKFVDDHVDVSRFTTMVFQNPTPTCGQREYFRIRMDGQRVCASRSFARRFFRYGLRRSETTTEARGYKEPLARSSAELDISTWLPTTSPPFLADTAQIHDPYPELISDQLMRHQDALKIKCPDCFRTENLKNIDPSDVESVLMMRPEPGCPILLLVKNRNENTLCVDASQPMFKILLANLDI